MQAIVISGSLEMGSSDQPSSGGIALGEPREDTPIPPALQVIHLPGWAESRPDTTKLGGQPMSLIPSKVTDQAGQS